MNFHEFNGENESKSVFNSLMMHCMIKIMIKQKNTTDACACDLPVPVILPVSVFACSPGNHRYQP